MLTPRSLIATGWTLSTGSRPLIPLRLCESALLARVFRPKALVRTFYAISRVGHPSRVPTARPDATRVFGVIGNECQTQNPPQFIHRRSQVLLAIFFFLLFFVFFLFIVEMFPLIAVRPSVACYQVRAPAVTSLSAFRCFQHF